MRLVLLGACLATLGGLAACTSEYHPEYHPQSITTVEQNISYGATIVQGGGGSASLQPAPPAEPVPPATPSGAQVPRVDPSSVLVAESPHPDRPTEVVGVVDLKVPGGSREASLALVRHRAADMGADAVIGLEFHEGAGDGQPSRVSGLAVRFTRAGR